MQWGDCDSKIEGTPWIFNHVVCTRIVPFAKNSKSVFCDWNCVFCKKTGISSATRSIEKKWHLLQNDRVQMQCAIVCCSVLQCVAVYSSVLQCVEACHFAKKTYCVFLQKKVLIVSYANNIPNKSSFAKHIRFSTHCEFFGHSHGQLKSGKVLRNCLFFWSNLITFRHTTGYGVAASSRLLKMIRLFCRIYSLL